MRAANALAVLAQSVFRGHALYFLPLHAACAEPRHRRAVVTEQGKHVGVSLCVIAVGQQSSGQLYFTRESNHALRVAISASKTMSSAMVSKWSTILLWPRARAYPNALTNQAKATTSFSTLAFFSNQTPS
jgi:hypothetical protein